MITALQKQRRFLGMFVTTVLMAPGALVLAACEASPEWRYEQKLLDTDQPALHAVHSERLEEIMARLDRIMSYPQWEQRSRTLTAARKQREIADVASSLALTAEELPETAADLDLSPENQKVFKSLADKLHSQAIEIESAARERNNRRIRQNLDRLSMTCGACHSLFRMP